MCENLMSHFYDVCSVLKHVLEVMQLYLLAFVHS